MAWVLGQVLVHALEGKVMMHLGLNSSGTKKYQLKAYKPHV